MKILVPSNGNDINSAISKTFGRAAQFLLIDIDTLETTVIPNTQNLQAAQGAGIQSAQTVAKSGADVLITMHCGPKAYRVLAESGVDIYTGIDSTVNDNINQFKGDALNKMSGSNVEGHWA